MLRLTKNQRHKTCSKALYLFSHQRHAKILAVCMHITFIVEENVVLKNSNILLMHELLLSGSAGFLSDILHCKKVSIYFWMMQKCEGWMTDTVNSVLEAALK